MKSLDRCKWCLALLCLWIAGRSTAAEYWVSPTGNDANAGTQAAPWQTLGKAAAVAAPGDTMFLRAGTYGETLRPANSGEADKPIRFVGAPGERPILSGADALSGAWQPHRGSIYKLQTNLKFIQLFVDGKMMPEARWPNTPPGELMTYNRAAAGEGTGYEVLADQNLPAGDWNGGIVLFWPGSRWVWNCSGSGIRMNSDALNHLVANNTIQQVREPFGTYCYSGYTPTMKGTRVLNNLVNEAMNPKNPWEFVQGELGPELSHCAPGAVDRDGYPTEGSAAIDAGVTVAGITDGFRGQAPDLGAYEFGGPRWTAGADWKDPEAPPVPARNLAYTPHPPITEKTMITKGLAVWLDAADRAMLDVTADGTVTAWRDKSAAWRVALPALPNGSVKWVPDGMNGKPTVRGNGTGSLRLEDLQGEPKPITVFVVSQSLEPRGPDWQRIIASFTGVGQEWVLPNWMIGVPGGKTPTTWAPRLFLFQQRGGAALGKITVLGASAAQGQALGGDISEVLVFDRSLRFDETEAVTKYLNAKWELK